VPIDKAKNGGCRAILFFPDKISPPSFGTSLTSFAGKFGLILKNTNFRIATMYLLNTKTLKIELFPGGSPPPYAILSHTWQKEEILFRDIQTDEWRSEPRKQGADKVENACRQARSARSPNQTNATINPANPANGQANSQKKSQTPGKSLLFIFVFICLDLAIFD